MPLTYRSKERMSVTAAQIEDYKQQMKDEFNQAVDEILDNEIESHCQCGHNRRPFSFMSYIRGLYYLTFAKFTNPLAHRMAWQVLKKMQEREEEEEIARTEHAVAEARAEQTSEMMIN